MSSAIPVDILAFIQEPYRNAAQRQWDSESQEGRTMWSGVLPRTAATYLLMRAGAIGERGTAAYLFANGIGMRIVSFPYQGDDGYTAEHSYVVLVDSLEAREGVLESETTHNWLAVPAGTRVTFTVDEDGFGLATYPVSTRIGKPRP